MDLLKILKTAFDMDASDVHLIAGQPPTARVHQVMTPMDFPVLTPQTSRQFFEQMSPKESQAMFEKNKDADFSYQVDGLARYRVNAHMQRGSVGLAMRMIKTSVPPLAKLNLPEVIARLTYLPRGLVLVTGDTGSGKSTTLAAMIQAMNERYRKHIITLEDPVEFMHASQQSLVIQRELGTHVGTFKDGLRSALRQDPDVILVGELRDTETIQLALEAAETGHLVFGTLHTRGAAQSIDRMVDAHTSDNQSQLRHSLADNLKAVVSQELIRAADGRGRRAALEILVVTAAVAQLIREGKTFQIPSAIITGKRVGMQLMDQALLALVRAGDVDPNEAFLRAEDKWGFAPFVTRPELLQMMSGAEARTP